MPHALHKNVRPRAGHFRDSVVTIVSLTVFAVATGLAAAQTASPTPSAKQPAQQAESGTPGSNEEAKPSEPPSALLQLNSDLQSLAARVSPAVVQILVTGYGPLRDEDRSNTALIVRQHAVGSGVIVDSNGYIMTNAHVVEGAQRIRVALPLPMGDSGDVPIGKRRILEARLLGEHKETDLA
ncbi:MAG: trypsin-like peptidase domain-containing protein, partial [Thermoplasmata archaeon]